MRVINRLPKEACVSAKTVDIQQLIILLEGLNDDQAIELDHLSAAELTKLSKYFRKTGHTLHCWSNDTKKIVFLDTDGIVFLGSGI